MATLHTMTSDVVAPAKRKLRRRRLMFLWSILGGAVVLLGACAYLLFFSSVVKVREISVHGSRVATDDEVKSFLIKKLDARGRLARWFGSENIIYWLFARVDQDPTIPAAGTITITTSLIHRAVSIDVSERIFKGVWCGDTCVGFDANGIAFFLAPEVYGSLLLKIEDENKAPVTLGVPVMTDHAALSHLFTTLDAIERNGVKIDHVAIKDASLREWEAESVSGTIFKFSLDFVPTNLSGVFNDLRTKTKLEDLSYVDFRVENRVYYK